jgi:hypothetical protein
MQHVTRILSALGLMVGLLVGAAAIATTAQAATPTLEGEKLFAGLDEGLPAETSMYEVTLRCGAASPSWWSYSASGNATGPYPGSFTETGTVYVDGPGDGSNVPVLTVQSEFAIQSGTTVISGTRELKMVPTNNGSCLALNDTADSKFNVTTTYTATIDTASGSFTDSGASTVIAQRLEKWDISTQPSTPLPGISKFRSEFDSAGASTPTPPTGVGNSVVGSGLVGGFARPVVFGFAAKRNATGLHGLCGVFDPTRKTFVVCVNVDSYTVTGTRVVLTGEAYVNKVKTRYTMDITDSGSIWGGDTFKIETDTGYSLSGSPGLLGGIRLR